MIGSALNNIEDLLKMPYGCGEQNLVGFAPDVYILDYLKKSARLTDTIKSKAIEFINSGFDRLPFFIDIFIKTFYFEGYQRQLTYQRSDGSFSAFGESDKSGSTWFEATSHVISHTHISLLSKNGLSLYLEYFYIEKLFFLNKCFFFS